MTLITIFSAPKSFEDPHIALIQRNAIQSWVLLGKEVEVILMGRDAGVAEIAAELGVVHLPEVECNEKGVPYIGDMFRLARERSDSPLFLVINADIILFPDFLQAARSAYQQFKEFVLVGQRWDLDLTDRIEFSSGWDERLRSEISTRGRLHNPSGSDYFLFSRQVYQNVPDFTIGRAGWDNWMIHQATTQPWIILDATADITIVHQNHDYRHLPEGQIHYRHPESKRNVGLAGGEKHMVQLRDVPHMLVDGKVRRKPLSWLRLVRGIERWLQPEEEKNTLRWRIYWKVRKHRARVQRNG